MEKIREINVDNIVEFLNSNEYPLDYLTNRTWGPGSYSFKMRDYSNVIDKIVKFFFSDITYSNEPRNIPPPYQGSPGCHKEEIVGKVYRNINELSFLSMYSYIILNLYDKGETEFSIAELPIIYRFIIENQNEIEKHPDIKKESKILIRLMKNYLYGSTNNKYSKIYITNVTKVIDYYREAYDDLIKIDGFLFFDVDQLFFEDSAKDQVLECVNKLNIPYEINPCSNFCYFNKRRYVSMVDGEIRIRGYDYPGKPNFRNRKNSEQYELVEKIVTGFERELRNKKLNKLIANVN